MSKHDPGQVRILGIDPGSRITGFGVIEQLDGSYRYITSGCIRVTGESLAERLREIQAGLSQVIAEHQPAVVAIEQVFMHKNAGSALKLGQARGVAVVTAASSDIPVYEYTPTQVKQAVVGKGNAAKGQVNHMIQALLKLAGPPQEDAADALAIAVCHSHMQNTLGQIPGVRQSRRKRLQ